MDVGTSLASRALVQPQPRRDHGRYPGPDIAEPRGQESDALRAGPNRRRSGRPGAVIVPEHKTDYSKIG